MVDICIIGAGIIGACCAAELCKYNLSVTVLEKEPEASMGTSKANSGIIHAGHSNEPGSLRAKFNVLGSKMFKDLSVLLDIPYLQNGSLVLAFDEKEEAELKILLEKGRDNGVKELSIIDKASLQNLESNISENAVSALYAPTGAIISPYEAVLAFAENAFVNGADFRFNTEVINIISGGKGYIIEALRNGEKISLHASVIINAAGLFADMINNMVSNNKCVITPRKGEYALFDIASKGFLRSTVFQLPSKYGKGVLVTPTVHGNTLIGPSAEDITDKNDLSTHADTLEYVLKTGLRSIKRKPGDIITSFTGLRAGGCEDFVIEESLPGFINALGIDSPGLSSAPAIAEYIASIIVNKLSPGEKKGFIRDRKAITVFNKLSLREQNELIKENPAYGRIICRCETVTEGEILEAVRRPLGAVTMDGIKRRTRAGMGRCQSGFCCSGVMDILASELKESNVTKFGHGSKLLAEEVSVK